MGTEGLAPAGGSRRPEKREAIVRAAALVFGREGYARASVDTIAAEAGVSKRTVYNHFGDKETLFLTASVETAGELTEHIAALADRHLRKVVDVRVDLADFAVDRARAVLALADSYALPRAIRAEAANLPPDVLKAWLEAGPVASVRDLAAHLERIAGLGLLAVDDPVLAAEHFNLLTFSGAADRSFWGAVPLPDEELVRIATAGVDTFLRLYGAGAAGA
ncbi:TetR/AcrR family transcriptional regulator [Streptomyces sp. NPDC093225]|uniref:TetR/AcrR family transcriptional regulator n=1 Tax=Streptomyces sp. NPDC093225 TaxID=3366034 RepID=UPI0037F35CC2